jgi:phosphoglycolate phosphatase
MDSIIFDVDGTLWDSTGEVADAWVIAAKECGAPYEHITGERLHKEFGKTMEAIGISLFPEYPAEEAVRIIRRACDIENEWLAVHHAALYDGVLNTLKTLSAKMPLFIVSNCQGGYIEVMKETTGLTPYITDHLCPDDTVHAKASNIRAIVEKHNLKSPIYVGDTQGDLNASREAGVKFVFASYGFGQVDSYDGVIEKPDDLLTLSETEI